MTEAEKLAKTLNGCLSALAIIAVIAGLGCCVGPLTPVLLLGRQPVEPVEPVDGQVDEEGRAGAR